MWVLYPCQWGIVNYGYNGDHKCIRPSYHSWQPGSKECLQKCINSFNKKQGLHHPHFIILNHYINVWNININSLYRTMQIKTKTTFRINNFLLCGTQPAHFSIWLRYAKTKYIKQRNNVKAKQKVPPILLSRDLATSKDFTIHNNIKNNEETKQKVSKLGMTYISSTHQRHKKWRNHDCSS